MHIVLVSIFYEFHQLNHQVINFYFQYHLLLFLAILLSFIKPFSVIIEIVAYYGFISFVIMLDLRQFLVLWTIINFRPLIINFMKINVYAQMHSTLDNDVKLVVINL